MCPPSFRSAIIGALLAASALLLGGCSALRLAYDQGPELAYWWMDRFADFDEQQAPRVREAIGEWFRWHRRTQLADYAGLLGSAEDEIARDATPAQVCRWDGVVRERIGTAFDAAVPAIAAIAPSLTPEQLRRIGERFDKRNAEFRDDFDLDEDIEAQQRAAFKRALERAEMFYGRLDDAQRERLRRGIAASPFDAGVWLAERKARQADILQTLRRLRGERLSPVEAEGALRAVAAHVAHSPRADYRAYERTLRQYNCQLAAEMHNSTTPAQRRNAVRKLQAWESDLLALAGEVSPPRRAAPRRDVD